MKTGTRRFILRLMVAVLTFLIGVVVVMLLTGFKPFERFSYSPYYRHGRCGAYRNWSPPPPPAVGQTDGAGIVIYPSSPPLKAHATLGETPSTLSDAPLPPPPPPPPRTVR